jgi:hypothetical protein
MHHPGHPIDPPMAAGPRWRERGGGIDVGNQEGAGGRSKVEGNGRCDGLGAALHVGCLLDQYWGWVDRLRYQFEGENLIGGSFGKLQKTPRN